MTLLNDTGLGLARRLVLSRVAADMDQATVARKLGVARTTVSAWELGKTEPSATNFVRWALVTGQSLQWLAEGCTPWDLNPEPTDSESFWAIVCGLEEEIALTPNLENRSHDA